MAISCEGKGKLEKVINLSAAAQITGLVVQGDDGDSRASV